MKAALKKAPPWCYEYAKKTYLIGARLAAIPRNSRYRRTGAIKIDMGSGPKRGTDGWTTVDRFGSDVVCDITKRLPFPDNSAELIYCSHVLEHIPQDRTLAFLAECRRVLSPGGTLSVAVPDARRYIEAYLNGHRFRTEPLPHLGLQTGALLDELNYIAYLGGEHLTMFDEDSLKRTLAMADFHDIEMREFSPSLDIEQRAYETIYVDARP